MTQADLARKVGVSVDSVANWERDRNQPTHDNVEAIAKAIGVSLPVFYGDPPSVAPTRRKVRRAS